jgi:hypothetical protein
MRVSLRSRGNIQSPLINSHATLALVSPGMNVEKTLVQNCRSSTLIISLLKSHLSSVYNICLLKNPYPRFYTDIISATSARVSGPVFPSVNACRYRAEGTGCNKSHILDLLTVWYFFVFSQVPVGTLAICVLTF